MLRKYLDVDRLGNGFILTVKHGVNKKGEPTEDICQVVHLGPIGGWYEYVLTYQDYDLWPRAKDSGDIYLFYKRSFE